MGATEKIARFIVDTSYEDLPCDAVEKAKRTALDCVGAALAGVVEPVSQTITGYATKRGGQPQASIFGAGLKVSTLALVSKFRFKTRPWPTAPLPMLWTTMTVV
jgi:2-methylcitrate dehydratase PrpD